METSQVLKCLLPPLPYKIDFKEKNKAQILMQCCTADEMKWIYFFISRLITWLLLFISHKPWLHSPLLSWTRGNSQYFSLRGLLSDFCLVLLNSQMFWPQAFCFTEPFYRFYRVRTHVLLGIWRCEQKKCSTGLGWKHREGYQGTLPCAFFLCVTGCI